MTTKKQKKKALKRKLKIYQLFTMGVMVVAISWLVSVQGAKYTCAGFSQAEMDLTRQSTFRTEPTETKDGN